MIKLNVDEKVLIHATVIETHYRDDGSDPAYNTIRVRLQDGQTIFMNAGCAVRARTSKEEADRREEAAEERDRVARQEAKDEARATREAAKAEKERVARDPVEREKERVARVEAKREEDRLKREDERTSHDAIEREKDDARIEAKRVNEAESEEAPQSPFTSPFRYSTPKDPRFQG